LCFNQLSGIEEAENVYQNIKLSYKKNNNNSEPPKPLVLQKRDKLIKLIESIKSHL